MESVKLFKDDFKKGIFSHQNRYDLKLNYQHLGGNIKYLKELKRATFEDAFKNYYTEDFNPELFNRAAVLFNFLYLSFISLHFYFMFRNWLLR